MRSLILKILRAEKLRVRDGFVNPSECDWSNIVQEAKELKQEMDNWIDYKDEDI